MKKNAFLLIVSLAAFSCTSVRKNNASPATATSFDFEAHRGGRGLMPENTIPAMRNAIGMEKVQTLEMDVVITKDGQVLVSHDPYFNHDITTKSDGTFIDEKEERNYKIYEMSYSETQRYDVGMKVNPRFPKQQKLPAHKPLLSDLLDSVQQYMMTRRKPFPSFNIET